MLDARDAWKGLAVDLPGPLLGNRVFRGSDSGISISDSDATV